MKRYIDGLRGLEEKLAKKIIAGTDKKVKQPDLVPIRQEDLDKLVKLPNKPWNEDSSV